MVVTEKARDSCFGASTIELVGDRSRRKRCYSAGSPGLPERNGIENVIALLLQFLKVVSNHIVHQSLAFGAHEKVVGIVKETRKAG